MQKHINAQMFLIISAISFGVSLLLSLAALSTHSTTPNTTMPASSEFADFMLWMFGISTVLFVLSIIVYGIVHRTPKRWRR